MGSFNTLHQAELWKQYQVQRVFQFLASYGIM